MRYCDKNYENYILDDETEIILKQDKICNQAYRRKVTPIQFFITIIICIFWINVLMVYTNLVTHLIKFPSLLIYFLFELMVALIISNLIDFLELSINFYYKLLSVINNEFNEIFNYLNYIPNNLKISYYKLLKYRIYIKRVWRRLENNVLYGKFTYGGFFSDNAYLIATLGLFGAIIAFLNPILSTPTSQNFNGVINNSTISAKLSPDIELNYPDNLPVFSIEAAITISFIIFILISLSIIKNAILYQENSLRSDRSSFYKRVLFIYLFIAFTITISSYILMVYTNFINIIASLGILIFLLILLYLISKLNVIVRAMFGFVLAYFFLILLVILSLLFPKIMSLPTTYIIGQWTTILFMFCIMTYYSIKCSKWLGEKILSIK